MSETHTESKSKRNSGQFAKGNPGGPGNPHAKQVARIRATLLAALEPATLYEIVCRLIERAVNGNLEAIKILLSYTIGRPGKSNDLIELLSEHYPPLGQESGDRVQESADDQESGISNQESEDDRHQTDQTAEECRHQTVAQPVGQVADLPKAPVESVARTSSSSCPREVNRQQTDQTAEVRRQQTAQSARILTAGLAGGRHQTGVTDGEPDALLSLMGKVLERAASLPGDGSASEISLVK